MHVCSARVVVVVVVVVVVGVVEVVVAISAACIAILNSVFDSLRATNRFVGL